MNPNDLVVGKKYKMLPGGEYENILKLCNPIFTYNEFRSFNITFHSQDDKKTWRKEYCTDDFFLNSYEIRQLLAPLKVEKIRVKDMFTAKELK